MSQISKLPTDVLLKICTYHIPHHRAEATALQILCHDSLQTLHEHIRTACTVHVTFDKIATHARDVVHIDLRLSGGTEEYRDRLERALYDAFPQTSAYGGKRPRNSINPTTRAFAVSRDFVHEWEAHVFDTTTDPSIFRKESTTDGIRIQYKLLR